VKKQEEKGNSKMSVKQEQADFEATEDAEDIEEGNEEAADVYDPNAEANLSEEERLALQKERHKTRRAKAKTAIKKGLVLVNTGKGKGKTTAAMGLLLRAWGQGKRVCMLQFIKAKTANWGEEKAARKIGIEIVPLGDGFTWLSDNIENDKELARQGWTICRQRILSGEYDLIVLDEMTYPLKYGWLDWSEVRQTLEDRSAGMHIVITGRYAIPELLEYADTVSEITELKHHYKAGVKAQKGIEF
jgi:cob(I)alamin adenosyltransferase